MFPVVQKEQLSKHNCQCLQSTFKFRRKLTIKYIDIFRFFHNLGLLISVLSEKSLATDLISTHYIVFSVIGKSGTI